MKAKQKTTNNDARRVIKLVRKANELVEARYKFDIWETRVFTKMLTMIRPGDKDFKKYRIYLKDIVKEYGLESNKDAYERLRAGGFKLMKKIVKVIRQTSEGPKELYTPIVVGLEKLVDTSSEEGKFIDVSFHPDIAPFLLDLQSRYTTYDVNNILKLPSSYSVRIYELLKQYQKIGWRKFELNHLKEIIGVIEEIDINGKKQYKDNYPLYGNFKQRVLNKAQKDLATYTDITFTFEALKKGRKVHALKFFIESNQKGKESIAQIAVPQLTITEPYETTYEQVKLWVSKDVVRKWFRKYPIAQVQNAVAYTLEQLKAGKEIENVAGYLQIMVKQKEIVRPEQRKKQLAKQKRLEEEKRKLRRTQLEASCKMLQLELKEQQEIIAETLLLENPILETELIQQLQMHQMVNYQIDLSLNENLEQSMLTRSIFYNKLREKFTEAFVDVVVLEQQIKQIQIEIYQLN